MNEREDLQIAAYERTLALLNNYPNIIQNIAVITETKNALDTAINAIRLINVEEKKGTGGAMGAFVNAKTTLFDTTLAVQGALLAYATIENNLQLLEATDLPVTYFKKGSNEAFYDKCKIIYDLALPVEATLTADYQLPQDIIDQLGIALEAYRLALPNKSLAKKEQKGNTKKRKEAFAHATAVMDKLSKLLLIFRSTKPDFYNQYLEVSHIGGYTHKKSKNGTLVTGQAVDFETHEAIANAKISVVLQQSEAFSGADGNFSLAVTTPGEITIKAEKAGYTLWEDNIIIEAGENVTMLIEMEK